MSPLFLDALCRNSKKGDDIMIAFLSLLIASSVCVFAAKNDLAGTVSAANGVLRRVLGKSATSHFHLSLVPRSQAHIIVPGPKKSTKDSFVYWASGGEVWINGTSGVALASGAYHYLKNSVNCQMTWGENQTGNQMSLPYVLPDSTLVNITTSVPWRYAWNVCTFQYSAVWWDWKRWQNEIDWLAMHGINLPLALTGTEYIWFKVYQKLGVDVSELQSWFTGPAFLAWQRMGNIRGFAGPLSKNWLEQQYKLQKRIVGAMQALDMIPVLPCFNGHVPKVTQRIFPNATYRQSPPWVDFPPSMTDVYFLDPTDPTFVKVGTLFMEEVTKLYGKTGYYSCDTFNEIDPTSTDLSYLKAAGSSVIQSIQQVDNDGVWVMQAWLFRYDFWRKWPMRTRAYLSGIPKDSLLVLDLTSEADPLAQEYENFYDKHWVWNLLHNYGGVRGMYGNLTTVATGPMQSLKAEGSTMVGIGFTPESIHHNPVMYELLTDTFYTSNPIDVSAWLEKYITQRYGLDDEHNGTDLLLTWHLLQQAVYNQHGEPRSEIEHIPTSGLKENPDFGWQYGNATIMFEAWEKMMAAVTGMPDATSNSRLQYDFVDVSRQSMTMFFSDVHRLFCSIVDGMGNAVWKIDNMQLWTIGNHMLDIIQTIDDLLGTNPNYLLGVWLDRAHSRAVDIEETARFDFNAKNQITMWGPNAEISDYAAKAWQGLYASYYSQRWRLFLHVLIDGGLLNWDPSNFRNKLLVFEKSWCHNSSQRFSPVVSGKLSITIANKLHALAATRDLSGYEKHSGQDIQGNNYKWTSMWTTNLRQLAKLCNLTPTCVGFDSEGQLKTAVGSLTRNSRVDTYLKKTNLSVSVS
jgi:alpha-N-acetylglucosaminidase